MICPYCKGSDFYEDANGYHNCQTCGVQSQELFSESFEVETCNHRTTTPPSSPLTDSSLLLSADPNKVRARRGVNLIKREAEKPLEVFDFLEVFQHMLMILAKVPPPLFPLS